MIRVIKETSNNINKNSDNFIDNFKNRLKLKNEENDKKTSFESTIYFRNDNLYVSINKFGNYCINETKLSRIVENTKDSFMIISAFRSELPIEENVRRHNELKKDLREFGLGFTELIGFWDENTAPQDDEEYIPPPDVKVNEIELQKIINEPKFKIKVDKAKKSLSRVNSTELSLFVPYKETKYIKNRIDFDNLTIDLIKLYEQYCAVIYENKEDKIYLLYYTSRMKYVGKLNVQTLGYAYSVLRFGKDTGKIFRFEGYKCPGSYIEAMGYK